MVLTDQDQQVQQPRETAQVVQTERDQPMHEMAQVGSADTLLGDWFIPMFDFLLIIDILDDQVIISEGFT